ncbi:MAG: hypothetical protein JSW27_06215 [Phycisphaerales bacterium]|nr:MAG: hypothetical protein JSW27_06215 [Phycisphaerales bacterium]
MNGLMEYLDRKVRRFSFVDVKLLQLLGAFLGIIVVKLVPEILDLSLWALILMAALCAVKPCCVFFQDSDAEP